MRGVDFLAARVLEPRSSEMVVLVAMRLLQWKAQGRYRMVSKEEQERIYVTMQQTQ